MSFRLVIKRAAHEDVEKDASWYDGQRAGLGEEYIGSVVAAFHAILRHPERYRTLHRDVRRYLVQGFPYVVYYRVQGNVVKVLAVLHSRRDSHHWRDRVEP